ncbi:hypothetical protein SO802_024889 [Lithocarpus litseifolius]|uniref:Uncharacterized protein n=1 Tax=Lithocarpus litseifolius TaxID=425828 RepID=A0AAW2CBL9_9ROSI
MVFKKTRKDKGKKQTVLIVEEDDIAANGPSGDATSNFTKKVENGSSVAKSSKASKVPAKNQTVLTKGETLVVEEIEDQDFLVKELEDQDIGHLVFNSYI